MVPISPREESDMLELMGFYFLQDNKSKAKEYWVQAAELREREGIQKPSLGYSPRYASLISQTTGKRGLNCHGMLMPILFLSRQTFFFKLQASLSVGSTSTRLKRPGNPLQKILWCWKSRASWLRNESWETFIKTFWRVLKNSEVNTVTIIPTISSFMKQNHTDFKCSS